MRHRQRSSQVPPTLVYLLEVLVLALITWHAISQHGLNMYPGDQFLVIWPATSISLVAIEAYLREHSVSQARHQMVESLYPVLAVPFAAFIIRAAWEVICYLVLGEADRIDGSWIHSNWWLLIIIAIVLSYFLMAARVSVKYVAERQAARN